MADPTAPAPGQIGWFDLTVPDAESVRDFYQHVTGWSASPVDMGGYQDYCMPPPGSQQPVSGICHARGSKLVLPPKSMGQARYYVIQDPAGAAAGLYEGPKGSSGIE